MFDSRSGNLWIWRYETLRCICRIHHGDWKEWLRQWVLPRNFSCPPSESFRICIRRTGFVSSFGMTLAYFSHVFWMWPGQSLETSERWVDVFPISSSKGEAWKECQILAAATNTVNEKRWDTNTQRRGTNQNKGILCWWLALRCDHFGANKTKVTVGAKKEAQNLLAHYHCEICPTLSKTIWA